MRKFASIFFATTLLLSGGLLQFVVHVCPLDGAMLSSVNCENHIQKTKKSCCEKTDTKATSDDCCSDEYVFMVSAKFGGISQLHVQQQSYCLVPHLSEKLVCSPVFVTVANFQSKSHSPPNPLGRELLLTIHKLSI